MTSAAGRGAVVALLRGDSLSGQRAAGHRGLVAVGAALQTVVAVALAVALATWTAALGGASPGDASPGAAAAGVVVLAFGGLCGACVAGPLFGGHAARLLGLVRWASAPLTGRELLGALWLREALGAPVAPAWLLAVGASAGVGGPTGAVSGSIAATAIVVGLVPCALVLARALRTAAGAGVRLAGGALIAGLVVALSVPTRVAPTWDAALAALGSAESSVAFLPPFWAAAALDGNVGAWVALTALAAAGLLCGVAFAPRIAAAVRLEDASSEGSGSRRRPAPATPRCRAAAGGTFAALRHADRSALRRDPELRGAAWRHLLPATIPVLGLLAVAWRGGDGSWTSNLRPDAAPLLVHVAVVAAAGVAVRLLDLGGGPAFWLRMPVTTTQIAAARALSWLAIAAPVFGVGGALVVLVVGGGAWEALAGAAEGMSAAAAGAGAGIVCAAVTAGRAGARRGAVGLISGLAAGLLAAGCTGLVAVAFRLDLGLGPGLGLGLGPGLTGALVGVLLLAVGIRVAGCVLEGRRDRLGAGQLRGG